MSFKKKTHTKSRAGCDVCRKRRVKCDEAVPTCGACLQRGDQCEYSLRFRTISKHSAVSVSPVNSLSSVPTTRDCPASPHAEQSANFRDSNTLLELELMHQWCTETYLGSAPEHAHLFKINVVRTAFRYSYLMDSLLALSALHIASGTAPSEDSQLYLDAGLQYQNRSISRLGELIVNVTSDNYDAVLISSILNMICALLTPLIPTTCTYEVEPTVDMMVRVRSYMMGVHVITEQHKDWLLASSAYAFLGNPPASSSESYSDSLCLLKDSLARNASHDFLMESVFQGAVNDLENLLASNGKRSVLGWILLISHEYISTLERREVSALVILMYWGALMCTVDSAWWTKYAGRRIVKEMSLMVELLGGNWEELLE